MIIICSHNMCQSNSLFNLLLDSLDAKWRPQRLQFNFADSFIHMAQHLITNYILRIDKRVTELHSQVSRAALQQWRQ